MRTLFGLMLVGGLLFEASALAQPPGGGRGPREEANDDDLVDRMFVFDKDKDGKLVKTEITDERLHRLFDRADADKDGTVTKEELTALAKKEGGNGRGFPGFGPPGGGPGGPGGPMMGFPRPGEVLPPMVQQRLRLSPEQKTQLADLQKEVDAKLASILNDDQKKQLKDMRERGPGGFGPPGGRRGPGGGPPPFDRPR